MRTERHGLLAGVTPVWASEIEPFPIRVTTMRFPTMKHYGDISRMDGGKIEPVDIITFGSPCTDMNVGVGLAVFLRHRHLGPRLDDADDRFEDRFEVEAPV